MIDRQKDQWVMECDLCLQPFDGERGERFEDFLVRASAEGWKAHRVGGAWIHHCPDCEGSK